MRAIPRGRMALILMMAAWPAAEAHAADGSPAAQIAIPAEAYLAVGGDVVRLGGAIGWRVSDPASASNEAIPAALMCAFRAAATRLALRHGPGELWRLRLGESGADGVALRDEFLTLVNDHLQQLGIAATRAELTAAMPEAAEDGSDAAVARAVQTVAAARADAAAMRAQAEGNADAQRTTAAAASAERVAAARASVAPILALEHRGGGAEPALLDQIYHDRIGAILAQAGSVTAIDAKAVSRVILPGAAPR